MRKPTAAPKGFDCVEMKRRIQEKIYAETRGMSQYELLAYLRRRVTSSRFAPFFGLSPKLAHRKPGTKGSGGDSTPATF